MAFEALSGNPFPDFARSLLQTEELARAKRKCVAETELVAVLPVTFLPSSLSPGGCKKEVVGEGRNGRISLCFVGGRDIVKIGYSGPEIAANRAYIVGNRWFLRLHHLDSCRKRFGPWAGSTIAPLCRHPVTGTGGTINIPKLFALPALSCLTVRPPFQTPKLELEGQLRLGLTMEPGVLSHSGENDRLWVRIRVFGDPADEAEQPEHHRFEVACRYALAYGLRPGYNPSTKELDAFRGGNAIFHCWPYSRELVQNMTMRMGLPIPPLPFLRLAPKIAPKKSALKRSAKPQLQRGEEVTDH